MQILRKSRLLRAFQLRGRTSPALMTAFVLVNGLVLVNAALHDPRIGYDARGYAAYVEVLSEGRLPGPRDSYEYLSPPLPFVLPATVRAASRSFGVEAERGRWLAWKSGQLGNLLWSMLLTFFLLDLGRLLGPDLLHIRLTSLLFVGLLPVYQQSFAGMRAEPLVASLTVTTTWATLWALRGRTLRRYLVLGILLGLLALTRQWALAVVAGIGLVGLLHLARAERRGAILRGGCLAGLLAFTVCGGFYWHLHDRYGSLAPHQQLGSVPDARRANFSFRNQPRSFYLDMRADKLFSDPVFPALPNRLLPQLHSTLWGDYWGFWVVAARDLRDGSYLHYLRAHRIIRQEGTQPAWLWTNRDRMGPYLGLVNAVSLLPSSLLLASLAFGIVRSLRATAVRRPSLRTDLLRLATAVIVLSLASYGYFLLVTPDLLVGTTLKAMYQLHVFPLWALLVAALLETLRGRSRWLYGLLLTGLAATFLWNARMLITSYREWW
ncbi:MAG: hypothetical protein ABFS46_14080 [Myxococcota bacterium]